jgi:hypothetical protein
VHRENRPEGLLGHRRGGIRDVGQHHRLHEGRANRLRTTNQRLTPTGHRISEVTTNNLDLIRPGDRPQVRTGLATDSQSPSLGDDPLSQFRGDVIDDVNPLHPDAGLPGIGHGTPDRGIGSGSEVGVGVHQ